MGWVISEEKTGCSETYPVSFAIVFGRFLKSTLFLFFFSFVNFFSFSVVLLVILVGGDCFCDS